MEKEVLLNVNKLNVKINHEKIIDDLSFQVKKNDFLTILGPNGAGKSTLLRALIGKIPFEGKILFKEGLKISFLPERLSRRKFKEIPITVWDFFSFKKVSEEEALKMLKMVEMEKPTKCLRKNPGNLSSGQFQKVLIAWSLIRKPDILLFDEPTIGIDIGSKETIYSLLEKFRKDWQISILMVTHDLNVVYSYSNKVLCLYKKANCFGKPEEILTPQKLQELYKSPIKFYKHSHKL